jgi:anti-sigma B factor antagonist
MEADSMLEVDYQKASGYTVCRAVGELDGASAPRLREALTGDPAPDRLVIDLTGVSFVDSAGLGALIGGIRRTREASGAVAISTPRPGLTRVLRTAGFDRIVPMEPTVEAAAAALGADGTTIDPSAA